MQTCPSFLVLGGTSSKETGDGTHLKREKSSTGRANESRSDRQGRKTTKAGSDINQNHVRTNLQSKTGSNQKV